MEILISFKSSVPIYEQIGNQVKDAVLKGDLKEGEILPSVRGLAKDLGVSILTVQKAYDVLQKDRIIESVKGKGNYVRCEYFNKIEDEQIQIFESHAEKLVLEAKRRGYSKDDVIKLIEILFD
ncbi:GntR family transcriptional regulator [Anaerocolumna sp. MB42-C2]|uniref:GntR family transcriptional regulator n=1 Tax=Anaerocolumna sp. MB42-C2 TaxID=3070997 RepID=UPI0027E1C54C|nr:GntR family transcriptional regulator [Anaerocolumna sp. MB42-C2]WMJ87373.1 GntR family transcriptional regulator [Anaerocolumna sp. MB42-C2]